LSYEGYDYG